MIQALAKSVRVSPRKLRVIAEEVKKMRLTDALSTLTNSSRRGAVDIKKTLDSAIANAKDTKNLTQNDLVISKIDINEGPVFKRWRAVSKGSAHGYTKRTSHVRVVLNEIKTIPVDSKKQEVEKKSNTKSKITKEK